MAKLRQAKTDEEMKHLTVGKVRREYYQLSEDYNRILEQKVMLCPKCNEYKNSNPNTNLDFYRDSRWASGYFPVCKDCLKLMAEQRKSHREQSKECKESVQRVLRFMDRAYIDDWYVQCVQNVRDQNADAGIFDEHPSAFASYIRGLSSLPQFSKYVCWEDSIFGDDGSVDDKVEETGKIVKSTVVEGKKHFGSTFSDEDLMFLETEYRDWIARYECNTKAQEKVFRGLCMNELQRMNAIKKGLPTKDLDKAYQDWLDAGNLKPKQNTMDTFSEAQTLGTLIQKYEEERPLPKIDPDLEDVDKIGLYIDSFFKGHICKVLGIKNRFFNIYENVMKKYTVSSPQYDEEEDSEAIFDKVFGSSTDG